MSEPIACDCVLEKHAAQDAGLRVRDVFWIEYCTVHRAAPAMLAALQRVAAVVKAADLDDRLYDTMGYVEAAIRDAKGGGR